MKSVPCKPSPGIPNLEPTPNHDCHIARNTLDLSATDLHLLLRITQVRNLALTIKVAFDLKEFTNDFKIRLLHQELRKKQIILNK